jgi:hypothetical protein
MTVARDPLMTVIAQFRTTARWPGRQNDLRAIELNRTAPLKKCSLAVWQFVRDLLSNLISLSHIDSLNFMALLFAIEMLSFSEAVCFSAESVPVDYL